MDGFATGLAMRPKNTPEDQPLFGMTILLIEDSRYFSDAVRLMAIRSGARLRRADCLGSALKHIRIYRPDIVILDVGLPDGAGYEFVADLNKLGDRPPVIAISGDPATRRSSLQAGVDIFLEKPFYDLALFQQTVVSALSGLSSELGFTPRLVGESVDPDQEALSDDIAHLKQILERALGEQERGLAAYSAQFMKSLGQVSDDASLRMLAAELEESLMHDRPWGPVVETLLAQISKRIAPA